MRGRPRASLEPRPTRIISPGRDTPTPLRPPRASRSEPSGPSTPRRSPRTCEKSPMSWRSNPPMRRAGDVASRPLARSWMIGLLALAALGPDASGAEARAVERYQEEIQPILEVYCYACHGYGMKKGGMSLDAFASEDAVLHD